MTYDPKVSKFLSYVLRHRPDSIGITLDKGGWASIDEIISITHQPSYKDFPVTLEDIVAAVSENDKQRFTLDLSLRKIRANQGHSFEVDLGLKTSVPPVILYHGTVSKAVGTILKEGLKPMSRQHVHLSADRETAEKVGSRRGKPVILIISTQDLVKSGHKFYLSDNGVWLIDHVPPKAISQ